MKRLIELLATPIFCFSVLIVGAPIAYAGCMDSADDAVLAFFTAGTSAAACELQELVDAIQNFIKTVSDLANNVMSNATQVANAAAGTVNSAIGDVTGIVTGAQKDLGNAVSEAQTMTSPIAMMPGPNIHAPVSNTMKQNQAIGSASKLGMRAATQGAPKPGPSAQMMAPIQLAADPQRLHDALVRGSQQLNMLKTSVDQDIAGRINSALQRAGNQATSHLADVSDIVKTALLAPINGLLTMLKDLVNHPTTLLDPIATINTMVDDISKNVVDTMNHINDVITKDAIVTLNGVEADVQQIQGASQSGGKLLSAMRRAHQEKTKAALDALESQLNALKPQQGGLGMSRMAALPAQNAFRFAPVHSKINSTLQKSVMPYQTISSSLKSNWAKIQSLHLAAKPRPLDMRTRQTAQNQLDQMFRGKSPADVERVKQDLLNKARAKFGSDPKIMASIEQNLDSYVKTNFGAPRLHAGPSVKPPNPNNNLNPLPPRQNNLRNM